MVSLFKVLPNKISFKLLVLLTLVHTCPLNATHIGFKFLDVYSQHSISDRRSRQMPQDAGSPIHTLERALDTIGKVLYKTQVFLAQTPIFPAQSFYGLAKSLVDMLGEPNAALQVAHRFRKLNQVERQKEMQELGNWIESIRNGKFVYLQSLLAEPGIPHQYQKLMEYFERMQESTDRIEFRFTTDDDSLLEPITKQNTYIISIPHGVASIGPAMVELEILMHFKWKEIVRNLGGLLEQSIAGFYRMHQISQRSFDELDELEDSRKLRFAVVAMAEVQVYTEFLKVYGMILRNHPQLKSEIINNIKANTPFKRLLPSDQTVELSKHLKDYLASPNAEKIVDQLIEGLFPNFMDDKKNIDFAELFIRNEFRDLQVQNWVEEMQGLGSNLVEHYFQPEYLELMTAYVENRKKLRTKDAKVFFVTEFVKNLQQSDIENTILPAMTSDAYLYPNLFETAALRFDENSLDSYDFNEFAYWWLSAPFWILIEYDKKNGTNYTFAGLMTLIEKSEYFEVTPDYAWVPNESYFERGSVNMPVAFKMRILKTFFEHVKSQNETGNPYPVDNLMQIFDAIENAKNRVWRDVLRNPDLKSLVSTIAQSDRVSE